MKPSFQWGVHCQFLVEGYNRAVLSIPALAASSHLNEKDLLARGSASPQGKATLAEHLSFLDDRKLVAKDAPLLILGIRNSLVNLRAPIIWKNRAYAVDGERPEESLRPYYGIGSCGGKLSIGQALGGTQQVWPDFFISGVPVLWDGLDEEILLNLMLIEAADHSHVFHLPRGIHPGATGATRQAWSRLHEAFSANVHASTSTAVSAMRSALSAIDPPPSRCDDYLNAVIGTRDDGAIVCIYAHGRLEDLGSRARLLGCQRAVCVENSGSVMPTYLPDGLKGSQIPLLRAPNFRPHGRAVIALELNNAVFSASPVFSNRRDG